MDLRPQAHDIIRTWLFYTVLRAHLEHGSLPWTDAAISGWVLDPDRKKMSKSKGNVVTPLGLLEEHGSDAVRYWAASGRPGADTAFDTGQMRVGRRLAIKILNASKFALASPAPSGAIGAALDRGMLTRLARLVTEATSDFDAYNYTRALERTETFFWAFCDDYLELVKARRYGDQGEAGAASANAAMQAALSVMLRLFAPFLPFVTEEVWSWWQRGSVHLASWPTPDELRAVLGGDDAAADAALSLAAGTLGEIRRHKSEAQRPMRTPVARLEVSVPPERRAALEAVRADLCAAGFVERLDIVEAAEVAVGVQLSDAAPPAKEPPA
jgi:valyl-tRNA synthetase